MKRKSKPIPKLSEADLARFWGMVKKTDSCWVWTGPYPIQPVFKINGINYSAGGIMCLLLNGAYPKRVNHTCHNIRCINPEHLFVGKKGRNLKQLKLDFFTGFTRESNGCWIWRRAKVSSNSYGLFNRGAAHVFSYTIHHGPVPTGKLVCHSCDTPLCVNPDHLFLGTAKDNTGDAVAKGRLAKGERHGLHKLTEENVLFIRRLITKGVSDRQIARDFNISKTAIRSIRIRHTWRHVL